MASIEDVAQIVAVISAAYPNFKATEYTVEVYYRTLQDLPADLLKTAVLQTVSEPGRKFAPSIGEIRGAVVEINRSITCIPSDYEAWEVVRMAFVDGLDESKIHPLVLQTIKLLGWRNLCMSTNQTADRARFLEAYNDLVDRKEKGDIALPEVRGYIEQRGGVLPGMSSLVNKLNVRNDETLPQIEEHYD